MAKSLQEWVNTDVKHAKRKGIQKLSTEYFFRDPTRPNIIDNELFYTPADGIILYQTSISDCNSKILEIKGINYTLKEILADPEYNEPCLIIGIFMTFYDVHVNRVPYSGLLSYESVDAIQSYNMPMLATEKDILKNNINPNNLVWLQNNERMINTIYSPQLDYTYYVVQIADEDVDVIMPFSLDQNEPYNQNERFSFIRWGSMCELVLPLDSRYNFELLQSTHFHVEGCYDALVKIHRNTENKYL